MEFNTNLKTQIQGPALGLLIWLVLIAFGGGLLAMYYATVGYFPDIKWDESLTYLAVLSILGGCIALAYTLLLFLPGVIWSEFLIFDKELRHSLCFIGNDGHEPCTFSILRRLGVPFAIFMISTHFFIVFGEAPFLIGSAVVLVGILVFLWLRFHKDLAKQ